MLFRKDVLKPGRYLVNGATGRRWVEYTRDDINHLASRTKEMVAAEKLVPVCWSHQDDAKPQDAAEAAANLARFNLGHLQGAEVEADGTLVHLLDVPDDADAKQVQKARYVSPEIVTDWVDGYGRKWPGKSITHVAVTPNPVMHRQGSFVPVQMGFSDCVRLSLDDLREGDMADEKEDKDKKDKPDDFDAGDDDAPATDMEDAAPAEDAPPPPPAAAPADGNRLVEALIAALAEHNIHMPAGTNAANFDDRLLTVLHGLAKANGDQGMKGDGYDNQDDATLTGSAQGEKVMESTQPVMMSLDKANERLGKLERDNLRLRINALVRSRRISKAIGEKLTGELDAVRMSFDREANLRPNKLTAKIEAYEDLQQGDADRFGLEDRRGIKEAPSPREAEDRELREYARKRAEAISKH